MLLTAIEIYGFKSFAHKITIPFGPGITAIVGPNGCGKSNVIEAIRWGMGEQRASAFRSHRMEEVIFAGTRKRKQLGMADVTITIDNAARALPIDFNEVNITRRLFRSGESDYLLNKVPCRLLDVQNLLMDTGLGPGAYSVMEQGMVDEIISERTDNRRRIIEEAAGITKYKVRRRSTWSKLESTTADLTRIEDIISEIQRQVDYLGRQVGRARRYQELKQEFDAQEILLGRLRFFAIQDQLRPLGEELARVSALAESGYIEFTSREAKLEKGRLAVTEAEKGLQDVGQRYGICVDEIHDQDRQLATARASLEASETLIARTTAACEEYCRQLETAQQQLAQAAAELQNAQTQLAADQERREQGEGEAAAAESAFQTSRYALDNKKRQQVELLRRQGEAAGALERLRTEAEGLSERQRQLEGEIGRLAQEQERAREQARLAQEELQERQGRLRQVQEDQQAVRQWAGAVDAELSRRRQQRDEARRALEGEQARLQALERLRSSYEGYDSGVRKLILDSPHQGLFTGVLGDLIEVTPGYDRVVETALGEALQALVAPGAGGVLEALRHLAATGGRAGIFPLEWQTPPPPAAPPARFPGLIGPLLRYVQADSALAPLLGRLLRHTFVVEDLEAALAVAGGYVDQELRFVTLQGDAVDMGGRVTGGQARDEDSGVLGRRRELRALRARGAHCRAQLHAAENLCQSTQVRSALLARRAQSLAGQAEALRDQEREQAHLSQRAQAEAQRLGAQLEGLDREHTRLAERLAGLRQSTKAQENTLEQLDQQGVQLEEQIARREEELQGAEETRRDRAEKLAVLRVEGARLVEQAESLCRDEQRLRHIGQNLEQNIERSRQEGEQAAQNRRDLGQLATQLTYRLRELHHTRDELTRQRDQRQEHWQEVLTQSRQLEELISRLQRELSAQRERRHELELKIAELRSRAAHISERLREEQHCEVEAMGRPEEGLDLAAIEARAEELRLSLQRLGSVNVAVLDEYAEQKERLDFLTQHRDDLLSAAEDLKTTLNRIDRVARQIFVDSFTQINEKFRETFARFFPGGEANLQLAPEMDPLEADIEITARPRGKRLQSISLLSGGERALTAISLLFAIYQVKPSPFCILDEVDAPLDDVNVQRFVRVLKEFAQGTQFIMVTHNKISMGAADTLHGVTMPEEGVSQLVSVRIGGQEVEEVSG
ncbi:MAG: chromosome segregation protein SMC [Candidatus Handelsmanbacteria bacterium]|nr:chromosome segregation protein SMC [Candidatus Handelsmanbacteria bacterium]